MLLIAHKQYAKCLFNTIPSKQKVYCRTKAINMHAINFAYPLRMAHCEVKSCRDVQDVLRAEEENRPGSVLKGRDSWLRREHADVCVYHERGHGPAAESMAVDIPSLVVYVEKTLPYVAP